MKKLLPIIGVAVLLLGGGGYYAYSTFLAGGSKKSSSKNAAKAAAAAAHKLELTKRKLMAQRQAARTEGPDVQIGADAFVVNLHNPGHYAKFTVVMKVDKKTPLAPAGAEATAGPELADAAQISDIINSDAYDYTSSQLVSDTGRERFKQQLAKDITANTDTLPLDIYFTTFAVQ